MPVQLRLPNIAGSDREQLSQIRSYLYQIIPQLEFALNNVSTSSANVVTTVPKSLLPANTSVASAESTFNSIKSLIIKSADIVDAYYQSMSHRLEGAYVAESDFGTFREDTEQRIAQSSTDIQQAFTNIQQILSSIDNLNFTLAEVNAYIRSGLIDTDDDGVPVYGLEIGQENSLDGVKVFNKFARFTADRLSFYDQNGTEVAYISDYKLYIRNVEINESLQEGGYKDFIDSNGGIITKWVGRG